MGPKGNRGPEGDPGDKGIKVKLMPLFCLQLTECSLLIFRVPLDLLDLQESWVTRE